MKGERRIAGFLASIVLCELAGNIGTIFTLPAIASWYVGLRKAPFNPPAWVFGPVWTTLFALMGASLYLVWESKPSLIRKKALTLFGVQFALNILWSLVFFGLKAPALAFAEIIVLWISILLTFLEFRKISRTAAVLLLPYIAWVSLAAVLNWYVLALN